MKESWRSSWLAIFFPINFAQGGAWPLVPLVILSFKGSVADISYAAFAYYGMTIISSKLWGRLSDYLGRRKVFILSSFTISTFLYLAFYFLTDLLQIMIASAILGFFLTAYIPSTIMLIVESSRRSAWADHISLYNLYSGLGWSSGLLFGALWVKYNPLPSFFIVCSAASALSAALAYILIDESPITLESDEVPVAMPLPPERKIGGLLRIPKIGYVARCFKSLRSRYVSELSIYYGTHVTFFTAFNIFFTQLPAFFKHISIDDSTIFILLGIHQLIATLSFPSVGGLVTRLKERKVITAGLVVRTLVFFFFLILSIIVSNIRFNTVILLPMLFLTGVSWALFWTPTVSLLSKMVDPAHMGEAQGNLNSIVGLGTVLGSLTSGYLTLLWGFPLNFLSAVTLMLAGLLLLRKVRMLDHSSC